MAQAQLDGLAQAQGAGDIAGHLAMDLGQRRGLAHGALLRRSQRLAEHGAPAADIVSQQVHEALGVGRTARPA
ncbi:hypothetical protein D3C85_1531480 [compost metagenome]